MPQTVINNCESKMNQSLEALKKELSLIRTGKANPAILNDVMVSYYGVPTPIPQIGSVSVQDAQNIVVKPWDKSILKEAEKAIQASGLGLNPLNDGEIIRIPIPPLNEDTRKNLCKQAKKLAEDNKVAIRNVRRDANDQLKKLEKDKAISEDDLKRYQEQIQKLTDKSIENVDKIAAAKEKDIMSI